MSPLVAAIVRVLLVLALGAVATILGSPLVRATFRAVNKASDNPAQEQVPPRPGALRGGAWIGRLERLSIFAGLVCHYPEAIAICLAMKGLARYPELKAPDSGAAEAFIIGTFVSVLWACSCAGAALWLVSLF